MNGLVFLNAPGLSVSVGLSSLGYPTTLSALQLPQDWSFCVEPSSLRGKLNLHMHCLPVISPQAAGQGGFQILAAPC